MTIKYKEFYNKKRGLPEPEWGERAIIVQCPSCGSRDMRYSAHPDDPKEVLRDSVRCERCGHITDYYETYKQWRHHPQDPLLEIER